MRSAVSPHPHHQPRQHQPHQLHQVPPHQAPRQALPPNYGPVFVHQEERAAGLSIESITVPLLLVFSVAVFLVGATYMATTQFHAVQTAIEKLGAKIDGVASGIKERLDRLEADNTGNLTKKDHELWCASAERANRNIGWACLEHPVQASPRYQPTTPTVQGWQVRTK